MGLTRRTLDFYNILIKTCFTAIFKQLLLLLCKIIRFQDMQWFIFEGLFSPFGFNFRTHVKNICAHTRRTQKMTWLLYNLYFRLWARAVLSESRRLLQRLRRPGLSWKHLVCRHTRLQTWTENLTMLLTDERISAGSRLSCCGVSCRRGCSSASTPTCWTERRPG